MKKSMTLLIAAFTFVAVHAQDSKDEARKVILGSPKGSTGGGNAGGTSSKQGRDIILGGGNNGSSNPSYPNSGTRQAQIDQVNREYDAKIYSIRNNGSLSQAEKERIIRQLEKDRESRIRQINNRYEYSRKHDDDDHEHHDHGKHKGWTKGKGNAGKHKHDD